MPITLRFPDPEFSEAFRAYLNYFEDLAGAIGGEYGWSASLVEGVHDAMASHAPATGLRRRSLDHSEIDALQRAMRKAWGTLGRITAELDDPDFFDEEANATIPTQAYYATYHALLGLAIAMQHPVPKNHAACLKFVGQQVQRGVFQYPWCTFCEGGPATVDIVFKGFDVSIGNVVHVLSRPEPDTTEDRLAMFLRTTRQKELERRFADLRGKGVKPGRRRRNLTRSEKVKAATSMASTTVFDIL